MTIVEYTLHSDHDYCHFGHHLRPPYSRNNRKCLDLKERRKNTYDVATSLGFAYMAGSDTVTLTQNAKKDYSPFILFFLRANLSSHDGLCCLVGIEAGDRQ